MRRQGTIRRAFAGLAVAVGTALVAASAAAGPPELGFRQVDINDSGRISPFEVRRAGIAEERFERWDRDGDGVVSRLEWRVDASAGEDASSASVSRGQEASAEVSSRR